jgi:hypothetical protein
MAVSIRVILYPMELRIRLVAIVLNMMTTSTTPTVASAVRVVVIVTSVTVARVIIPATVTPTVIAYTVHVVLMLGIITSVTCKHQATAWLTVTRVFFMCINIWMHPVTVTAQKDVTVTVCIFGTV